MKRDYIKQLSSEVEQARKKDVFDLSDDRRPLLPSYGSLAILNNNNHAKEWSQAVEDMKKNDSRQTGNYDSERSDNKPHHRTPSSFSHFPYEDVFGQKLIGRILLKSTFIFMLVFTLVIVIGPFILKEVYSESDWCPLLESNENSTTIANDNDEEMVYENPDYDYNKCHYIRIPHLFYLTMEEADLCRRMFLSVVTGSAIGLERRNADRPAGIRTMGLVSLGACFFTISSQCAFKSSPMGWDASRVTAAIPSGCGFLGAGLIWKGTVGSDARHEVHGLTTAAGLWLSAAIGTGCGGALYFVSGYSCILVTLILRYGPKIYFDNDSDDSNFDEQTSHDNENDDDNRDNEGVDSIYRKIHDAETDPSSNVNNADISRGILRSTNSKRDLDPDGQQTASSSSSRAVLYSDFHLYSYENTTPTMSTANKTEIGNQSIAVNDVDSAPVDGVLSEAIPTNNDGPVESNEETPVEPENLEDKWDLQHIFTIEEIPRTDPLPQECMTKSCPLPACTKYVQHVDQTNIWYSCLDCQEQDFGGWPEELKEYPVKFLTVEHRNTMKDLCTGQYSIAMPNIPINENGDFANDIDLGEQVSAETTHAIVEGNEQGANVISQSQAVDSPASKEDGTHEVVGTNSDPASSTSKKKKKTKGKSTSKTPPPTTLKQGSKSAANGVTPSPFPATSGKGKGKISRESQKMMAKWKEISLKNGGNGKVLINRDDIKKEIFELCQDKFAPMNITQIFQELKGTVPSAFLNSCLQDMSNGNFDASSMFVDSDDENDDPKRKNKETASNNCDIYAGSMKFKEGKNTKSSLYFVDYNRLYNNGNGMLPEDRNKLLADYESAKMELKALNQKEKNLDKENATLLSQPVNEELNKIVDDLEKSTSDLTEELDASRGLADNEKTRKKLKKQVDVFANQWKIRKNKTVSFLFTMEELTEGTVSKVKCLKGDGHIELESDEAIIKGAKNFLKRKRERGHLATNAKKRKHSSASNSNVLSADENFIGVELASNCIKRIYFDEE